MLHDAAMDRVATPGHQEQPVDDDRRASRRTAHVSSRTELLVLWHHDPEMPVRYRVLDSSTGGFRLRSSLPMLTGMTGHAVRILPHGTTLEKPIMIVWMNPARDGVGFELGLRFLEPA